MFSCKHCSCCCQACKGNWPLLDDLPVFTQGDLESRLEWVLQRVALENAAQACDVAQTKALCENLGKLAKVTHPHEALVLPEMYLHLANLYLNNSYSLRFAVWAARAMQENTV